MALDVINSYPNQQAKNALGAPIAILLLWLVSRLFSGTFDFLRRNRYNSAVPVTNGTYVNSVPPVVSPEAGIETGTGIGTGTVVPVQNRNFMEDSMHRTTKALRDLFIWVFSAWVVNLLVNGFNYELMIFIYCLSAVGILWALLKKPLHKFADILLLPVAVGVAFLFINALVGNSYLNYLYSKVKNL